MSKVFTGSLDVLACRVVSDGLVDYIEVPGVGIFDARDCVRGLFVDDERKIVFGLIGEALRCVFEEFRRAAEYAVGSDSAGFVDYFRDRWKLRKESRRGALYRGEVCGVPCRIRLRTLKWLVDGEEVKYVRIDMDCNYCLVEFSLSFTGRRIYWVWKGLSRASVPGRLVEYVVKCMGRRLGSEGSRIASLYILFP